jgi:hypothetical protein
MNGGWLAQKLERWKVSRKSGRNAKFPYYCGRVAEECIPPVFRRLQRERLLRSIETHPLRDEIESRAAYACRLPPAPPPPDLARAFPDRVGSRRWPRRLHTYFFDAKRYLRYFDPDLRFAMVSGDVTWTPEVPSFVKSRPIGTDNANSVLLNLNRVRHFIFVDDPLPWEEKAPTAVFRGKINDKPQRLRLFEAYFGKEGFDLGDVSRARPNPAWSKPHLSIPEQLRHRFILSIEGNDVASNLKWIFHSGSLAVMPRPHFETWFQEGRLEPGVHYIEVREDYADLPEKLAFYNAHPDLCRAMNRAEREWAARFRDPAVERLVSLRVIQRYFQATGQA